MAELATAWISIRASTGGMKGDVQKALTGIENQAGKSGQTMGQKISSGIGSTLKKGAVATGVAAGAALGTALTKGIGRLNAIEQAESKLTGLGHSASTVQGAMDSALKAVKGTAFGLDEAATTASMVMAAGIKPGKELEQVLTTVGDTAAIAGTSMAEMGDIFGKVAAKGKLQGDDLNRLTERGIPALQLLSEELGVTTEEAQKMASNGEISFEIFERAMRRGVGGAAQDMGNTTQGAFKNMMAAMGRFGATLAGPFFTQAGSVFRGLTDMFDNLDAKAGPVMERLGKWMESSAVPALQKFGRSAKAAFEEFRNSSLVTSSLARLEGVFNTLGAVGVGVGSALKDIGSALLEAGKALGVSAWQIFLSTLEAGSAVLSALVGPLQAVSGFMRDHPGLVTAAVAAWTAFKTVPGIMAPVVAGVTRMRTAAASAATAFRPLGEGMATYRTYLMQANPAMSSAAANVRTLGAAAGYTASQGFNALRTSARNVLSVFGGPWGAAFAGAALAVTSVIAGNQKLEAAQDQLKSSSSDLARAQQDMWRSMGDAAKVSDAIVDQVDAMMSSIEASINSAQRGITGGWNAFWEDLKTGNLFSGDSPGLQMKEQANMMADAAERARVSFQELGMSNRDVAASVQGTSGDYELLIAKLRGTADGGRDAIAQLAPLREEFLQQQGLSARVGEGYLSLQSSLGTLANEAASSDDRLNALRNTLELLGIISPSASQQIQDMASSVKQLGDAYGDVAAQGEGFSQSVDEFGNKFLLDSGELNLANANTHALADAYRAVADEVNTMVINGASYEEIMSAMGPQFDALGAKAADAGLDVGTLNDQFGLADRDIQASISVQGLEPAERDLVAVTDKMKDVENGATATVRLEGGDTSLAELRRLGVEIVSYDEKTGEAKIRVNDDDVRVKLNDANGKLLEFGGKSVSANMGANADSFNGTKSWIDQQLGVYNGSFYDTTLGADNNPAMMQLNATNILFGGFGASMFTATMGANPTPARNAHGGITGLMNQYTMSNPTTAMHANSGPAMGELGNVNNGMNQYAGSNPNTGIFANGGQALNEIGNVDRAANQATRDRVINITTRYHVETAAGMQTGTGTIPRANGGFLPLHKFADGGSRSDIPSGFLPGQAMIARPQGARGIVQWAERETEGEAFIPLAKAKRGRSTAILDQVANRFGYRLEKYADGGFSKRTPKDFLDFVHARTDHGQSRSLEGAPYVFSGINWGDCSAAMSAIARFAVDLPPFAGRFATANEGAALTGMGFRLGRGPAGSLRIGWKDDPGGPGGGHTAGTLPDGTNVEMGGGRGNGQIGGGAAGWNDGYFTDHAWLPANTIKVTVDGLDEPFGDFQSSFSDALLGKKRSSGITATSSAGSGSGAGRDERPKSWSEIAGLTAYNMVSGLTQDALGVFGVPDELPPILQAYNMMQDAEEHGGVSTWDVSTTAAKVRELEAQVELRKRLIAEGEKAVDVLNNSGVGNASPAMVAAAENKLTSEHHEMLRLQDDLSSAKARLQTMLDTRTAAELEKQAGASASSASLSELPELGGEVAPDVFNLELGPPKIEYDPAKGAEQWRPLVEYLLKEKGLASDKATVDAVIKRINQESTGNPRAQNNWDSNAAAGTPSKGLIQTIDPTFQSYKDPGHDDIWNPEDNLRASFNYVTRDPKFAGRSMKDIYLQAGGYWKGGAIPFGSGVRDDVPLVAAEGEYIVNRFAAARNRGLLEDINSGRSAEPRGGDTYNVYAFDLESSLRELDKRQKQRAFSNMGVR